MIILLKSARIIDPKGALHNTVQDIEIKDGIITKIKKDIPSLDVDKIIDLPDLHVSKGWFDTSVCFGEPGFEERETLDNGLNTAAKSGYCDILLNPNTNPIPDTQSHISAFKLKSANHIVELHPIGALTKGSKGDTLADLYDMKKAGALAFGDHKIPTENSNLLKIALQYAQNFDGLLMSFPQESNIMHQGVANEGPQALQMGLKGIPNLSEELRVIRDLTILEYTGGKLHIPTISTKQAVKYIAKAKKKGLNVSCSVAIHNLILSDKELKDFNTNCKVIPPLRNQSDITALRKAVLEGVIDYVTSDHTPVDIDNKNNTFDDSLFGTIGMESAFGALHSLFDLDTVISILTKGYQRFDLQNYDIAENNPAKLTLFNPNKSYVFKEEYILSTSKNSALIGHKLKGKAYGIIAKGECFL